MEPGNLFHCILLTISLVASGCFAQNLNLIDLLIGIKFVLLQKVFINVLAWTIMIPLVRLSSPPLYALFSGLQQAKVGRYVSLISIMHFCRIRYMRMSICLNLMALLIMTPFTLHGNSVRPFIALSRPPMLGTKSYISTYFLLAFPTLRQTPLCSYTIMENCTLYVLVYVDVIIITGNTNSTTQDFIVTLSYRFSIKDLGSLHYFLSVKVLPHQHGFFLSQCQYM